MTRLKEIQYVVYCFGLNCYYFYTFDLQMHNFWIVNILIKLQLLHSFNISVHSYIKSSTISYIFLDCLFGFRVCPLPCASYCTHFLCVLQYSRPFCQVGYDARVITFFTNFCFPSSLFWVHE